MANETLAFLERAPANDVAEDDYQSFCEALGASARGRAFLAEYAKRNRHADTQVVLAALDRFDRAAHIQNAAREAERIRQDLRALLDTLRNARPQIDNSPSAIKAATLAALIDFVQARIETLVAHVRTPQAQNYLSQVPEPDQPELPIPQPFSGAPATFSLVQTDTRAVSRINKIIPEIDFASGAAPATPPAPVSSIKSELESADAPVARTAMPPLAIEFAELAVAGLPAAAMPETYEIWAEPQARVDIETVAEADFPVQPPSDAIAAAPVDEPMVADIPPDVAAKIAGLSPRQAAMALLAAKYEALIGPQQTAAPAKTVEMSADIPIFAELPASAATAQMSPRQAAIAALAAQKQAEATGEQAIADPVAAIMELSEEERIALFT